MPAGMTVGASLHALLRLLFFMPPGRSSIGLLSRSVSSNCSTLHCKPGLYCLPNFVATAGHIVLDGLCKTLRHLKLEEMVMNCFAHRSAVSNTSRGMAMRPATAAWQSERPRQTMSGTELFAKAARHAACACLVSLPVDFARVSVSHKNA